MPDANKPPEDYKPSEDEDNVRDDLEGTGPHANELAATNKESTLQLNESMVMTIKADAENAFNETSSP